MDNVKEHHYIGKDLEAMSFAHNYHNWILALIKPWLKGSVAEVGAGMGNFSRLLLGCEVECLTAFEPSKEMYSALVNEIGSDPRATAVNDFFTHKSSAGGFDSIVYINVLEHIQEDCNELAEAWNSLRSGGHLIVFVPALSWLYSPLDREVGHFRRYNRTGLEKKVASAGFELMLSHYFDIAGILPWYVNFVLLKRSIGRGSVSAYDQFVVPIMRRVEGVVTPPVGKNILLVAKRP